MITPSPTGIPQQKELVEGDAAGNHPECAALVLGSHKQPWTRHKTPSFLLGLSAVHFFLGTAISAQKLFSVLEKHEGLSKGLAQGIDVMGKQSYARQEDMAFLCATFAVDSGFLHILGNNNNSL